MTEVAVPKMLNTVARDLWVAALRDTDTYPQTKGALQNEDGYCCLGVLCEVAVIAGVDITKTVNENGVVFYDGDCEHLPEAVVKWAGLDSSNPVALVDEDEQDEDGPVRTEREFVMLNDDMAWSFPAIADVVEAQL